MTSIDELLDRGFSKAMIAVWLRCPRCQIDRYLKGQSIPASAVELADKCLADVVKEGVKTEEEYWQYLKDKFIKYNRVKRVKK